jgi:hypothetical protein
MNCYVQIVNYYGKWVDCGVLENGPRAIAMQQHMEYVHGTACRIVRTWG